MKTEPAVLPSPLPSADVLLSDEVAFMHKDAEGADVQVRVPLAVGLLYAANALRAGEAFALGYPGDRIGRIARSDGVKLAVHHEVVRTFEGMVAFLDRYTEVLAVQLQVPGTGSGGGEAEVPAASPPAGLDAPGENFSPPAA